MTCVGKNSSEIKDDLVLITMYSSQSIQPNKFLQGGHMDMLRLYPLLTINQSIIELIQR